MISYLKGCIITDIYHLIIISWYDPVLHKTIRWPQGINKSANFRFLQRLYVIFGFRWDCPQSLASCRDGCAWEIAFCRDSPCDLASCWVSADSRITRTVSAGSHFSWTVVSAGSKRSRRVSAEAKYDGQSLQEAKISGLVYTCGDRFWR